MSKGRNEHADRASAVIVILAHRGDPTPVALATRWAGRQVRILTAGDLSRAGWAQRSGGEDEPAFEGSAVLDGQLVPNGAITGVLTLAPYIVPQELPHVVPADRTYVAAEMTSFLLFWLSRLSCPVLNLPTPTCLSGPGWNREQWVHAAAQCGIPTEPFHRKAVLTDTAEPAPVESVTLTVVGERVFGEADPILQRHALSLAGRARVQVLAVGFSSSHADARLLDADPFPNLAVASPNSDNVLDAILACLQSAAPACP